MGDGGGEDALQRQLMQHQQQQQRYLPPLQQVAPPYAQQPPSGMYAHAPLATGRGGGGYPMQQAAFPLPLMSPMSNGGGGAGGAAYPFPGSQVYGGYSPPSPPMQYGVAPQPYGAGQAYAYSGGQLGGGGGGDPNAAAAAVAVSAAMRGAGLLPTFTASGAPGLDHAVGGASAAAEDAAIASLSALPPHLLNTEVAQRQLRHLMDKREVSSGGLSEGQVLLECAE
jgi:hypothetical protein